MILAHQQSRACGTAPRRVALSSTPSPESSRPSDRPAVRDERLPPAARSPPSAVPPASSGSGPESLPKNSPADSVQTLETVPCYSFFASGCRLLFMGDFVARTTKPTPSRFLHKQTYVAGEG